MKNFCEDFFFFFFGDRLKNFCEDLFFFFGEHLRLCPWSLALASSIPVLGLESVCPRKGCPWPWPRIFFVSLALASSLVSSTPPLLNNLKIRISYPCFYATKIDTNCFWARGVNINLHYQKFEGILRWYSNSIWHCYSCDTIHDAISVFLP